MVREVMDAWNRGDLDAALEKAADDVVVDMSNSVGPDMKGIYRGKEEVRGLMGTLLGPEDPVWRDPEEIIEVDAERLIVVIHVRMRGRGSEVDIHARIAVVWTISGGEGRSLVLYQSKAEALEAVGLSE